MPGLAEFVSGCGFFVHFAETQFIWRYWLSKCSSGWLPSVAQEEEIGLGGKFDFLMRLPKFELIHCELERQKAGVGIGD